MSRRYLTTQEQSDITQRANSRCEYCVSPMDYAAQPFVFEHIIPVSRDGQTSLDNLALSCGGCNGHKYNKIDAVDMVEQVTVPLFHPRQHKWLDHFSWNEDYTLMIGVTSTGRATIDLLCLNRTGVVNIRKVLCLVGKHPPVLK